MTEQHAARITFIPHVRNPDAPTIRELAAGIDITEHFTDASPAATPRTATTAAAYLDRVASLPFDEAALKRTTDVLRGMSRTHLRRTAKGLQAFQRAFHRMDWALRDEADYRRHRRRCPTCNPQGFNPSAPIDIREYRRRVRNRRRRAR